MLFTTEIIKKLFKKFGKIDTVCDSYKQKKGDQKFVIVFDSKIEKNVFASSKLGLKRYFEITEV